jgi:protein-disulfide isomerase
MNDPQRPGSSAAMAGLASGSRRSDRLRSGINRAAVILALLLAWLVVPATTVSAQADDPVVAVLDGHSIRLSELDARWRDQDPGSFARLQQEEFEARRRALDSLVAAYLLDLESKRRGLTIQKLLDQELPKRMPFITEAEVLEAYTRSGVSAQGISVDQARDSLVEALEKQRSRSVALAAYLDELRNAGHTLSVAFDAPRQTIEVLPTDRVAGAPNAPVEVVEYGDFQCPICRSMVPVMKRLQAEHRDDVRLVWKDFPLDGHPDARPAAAAARCAADQGRFWEYHDKLFANQQSLGSRRLKDYARQVKLDVAAFSACVDKGTHSEAVQQAIEQGAANGVAATPTVFINGRLVVGAVPYDTYDRIIREELNRARSDKR